MATYNDESLPLYPFKWLVVLVPILMTLAVWCNQAQQSWEPPYQNIPTTHQRDITLITHFIDGCRQAQCPLASVKLLPVQQGSIAFVQRTLAQLGVLNSIHFLREQQGELVYDLWFEQGRILVAIERGADVPLVRFMGH